MTKKLAFSMLVFLVSIFIYAQNEKSETIRELLFKAKDITEKETFKSVTLKNYQGKRIENILYQAYVDGTRLIRRETIVNGVIDEIIISNRSGIYYISGNKEFIIKNEIKTPEYNPALDWNFMLDRLDWNYNCTYSMVKDKLNGIPCYKITMQSPDDEEGMAKMIGKSVQYVRDNKSILQHTFLALRIFWVGEKNNFIYSCAFYSANGKKIYSQNAGEIEFMKNIDKSFFATPKEFYTANNPEDLKQIYLKYRDNIRK